jgi:hypothetical protein
MRRLKAIGATAVVAAVLFIGAPAYATTGYPPPTTTPATPVTTPQAPVSTPKAPVSTPAASTTSSSGLAFTGADIGMMVGGGIFLLAVGTGLVVFTRRRTHTV